VSKGILEWPGKVDNVQDYLRESSVFVLPSYYREGVPRSTQEAMAWVVQLLLLMLLVAERLSRTVQWLLGAT